MTTSTRSFAAFTCSATPVVDRISRDIDEVLQPAVRQKLVTYGLEPAKRMQPAEIASFIEGEVSQWGKVIKDAGAKAV